MQSTPRESVWKRRMEDFDTKVVDIRFPDVDGRPVDQDEEWCEVSLDGRRKRIRFHDYDQVYEVPGLYEELFYDRLKCCSPSRVVNLLDDIVSEYDEDRSDIRVLDLGAGNGMVGDELSERGVETIVGIDIIPQARDAALRDRPDVYDDYLVGDVSELPEQQEERLRRRNFNCLTTVAALGFGDIPPAAFLKAVDLIETPGWLAFTIKEDFLREDDRSGFCRLVRRLSREQVFQIQAYRRYRHRISISGKPLFYVAMIARKMKDVPAEVLDEVESAA